ncbi:MAG: CobW family GTP-binding protein [Geminicoccaceae bacterium]
MTGAPGNRIPVTILTGFLGSGKTTLLAKLLRHPSMERTAVIINEFGEIGLDHDLIEASEETEVTLMGGCLCCTVKGDLIDTLRRLYVRRTKNEVPFFERMVIETTGLADPAPVLQSIMADRMLDHYYRLDGVVTLVDAANGMDTLDGHQEAVKQAAVADRIVITKTDLAEDAAIAALRVRLTALNPGARILEARQGDIHPDALLHAGIFDPATKSADVRRWLNEEAYASHHDHSHHHHGDHHHDHTHDVNRHDSRIQAFCVRHTTPIPSSAVDFFWDMLTSQRGPDLLRVKAILNVTEVPEAPLMLHAVQHVVHAPAYLDAWPSDDRDSRMVFITRDIPRDFVEQLLNALLNTDELQDEFKTAPGTIDTEPMR